MLKNKTYDVLKFITLQVLPPLATCIMVVFGLWNIPYGYEISETLIAIDSCLGIILGISSMKYNKAESADDDDEGAVG
jgi:hypothetical protein